ncbi:hypothetical protein DL764_005388 [Monosporascus ibericus]|uniref:Uncharacterized protein n=1 Tax=Monosporascus ibericus TaxID=155417 RepID=A0A4Q4T976_9PEZI|nr:hypothetical protein DL764_005388 [Monosporascus ibericus]
MAPDSLSLAGKIAIVTGAGREPGLGAGIATALARNGAAVVLNFVSDSTIPKAAAVAERLRTDYGVRVATIQADIASPEGAAELAKKTLEAFETDHIDILSPYHNHRLDLVRAVLPLMPPGGRIVNISSISSKISLPNLPFYNAAKAASDSLTLTWAAEMRISYIAMPFGRSHGITVNSVAPGPVVTDMQRKFRSSPRGEEATQYMIKRTRAAERLGEIEDVADAVLLIVQEKSRFITGQYIDVAGGLTDR